MQQQYQCPNCGAPVAFGARFCGNCGTELNWPIQQIQSPPSYQQSQQQRGYKHGQAKTEQRRTNSWLLVSVILIVVVLLIVGGVFAYNAISEKTLSVSDITAPIITNVVASPTEATAVITWTTNEVATSQVEYGKNASYGSASPLNQAPAISHSITLSSLEPNTTYHFRVKSKDKAGNQAVSEDDTFITSASKLTPPEDTLLSVEAFAVFTDPIGKFSVEYPSSWFIDSVSGEDAPHLSFNVVLEPDLEWEDEIDLGFVYDYHSLIGNAKWFNDMFVYLADEDLISANSYTVGDLTCWECKDKSGETISVLIDCDLEEGLLHLHYGYPIDTLTETEIDILEDYALHMLSTFRLHGPRISERELNIHKLVNERRQLEGLVLLEFNEFISGLAREHSHQQSLLNKPFIKGLGISHEGFDERAEKIFSTLGASLVGENVAMGYASSVSAVEAWMNSPGHKRNILDPKFRRTGIGSTGFFENPIYTQIFSD